MYTKSNLSGPAICILLALLLAAPLGPGACSPPGDGPAPDPARSREENGSPGLARAPANNPPEVTITSPAGNENWSGVQNITWQASDPDGDVLAFDLYLVDQNLTLSPIRLNLTNATSFRWDTSPVAEGLYRIGIIARDNDPDEPMSGNATSHLFWVSHRPRNRPPLATPLRPADGETVYSNRVTLEWSASDPDGDNLTYYVFLAESPFDNQSAPLPYAMTKTPSYTEWGLKKGATYTWTVLAFDGKVNSTMVEIRNFTIGPNRPPSVELLEPADGATINTPAAALVWAGADPDSDPVAYTVYLSASAFGPSSLPLPYATTRASSWPAIDLVNGTTYYWAVVPDDGTVDGAPGAVRRFSVSLAVSVDSPRVIGHAPTGEGVAVKPTLLVTFDRPMKISSVGGALAISPGLNITSFVMFGTTFQVSLGAELAHNTTYEVTVHTTATSLGGLSLATPFRWTFTTVAEGERDRDPPTVILTEPLNKARRVNATANITIMFSEAMNTSATGRAVSFEPRLNVRFSWLNSKGFGLRFVPLSPMPNGTIRVTITTDAMDESGNPLLANYTFEFRVGLQVPSILDWGPKGRSVAINSTVWLGFDRPMNLSSLLSSVTLSPMPKGNWSLDGSGRNFTFRPAGNLRPGTKYRVTVSPSAGDIDGERLGNGTAWSFTTSGPVVNGEIPWLLLLLVVIIAGAAVGGAIYMKRKKAPEEEAAAPEPGGAGAPAGPEGAGAPPGEGADASVAAAAAAEAGKAGAAGAAPPPAAGFRLPSTPEPFTVQDVFLLYRDGRLMMHIGQSAGEASFPGVLAAVQELFKKVPEKRDEDAPPVTLMQGGKNYLFERGKWTAMAAVSTGVAPDSFREEMLAQVRNVEAEVGAILPEWDGKHELLGPAKRFVNSMAVFTAPAQDVLDVACAEKVTLKGEVDFHQGYIRLRVAIRNCLLAPVSGAEFKMVYNRDALRLEQIQPALRQKGDDVILGDLGPDEKKQITFLLDPQICTESYLEGILTYKDPSGKLETAKMPKKLTSVVCPILATDENINTAMLKKMSDTELPQKATKVFMLPAGLTPPGAFEVAKSAVQHHDVKLVREFDEPVPFIGEAWYFGKLKGRDDRLVVRARVIAQKNMLEFYVASSSTLLLNGMLAELKNDLKKELDAVRGKAQAPMKQVTDQKQVDAVATFQSLLDKATELEKRMGNP